MMTSEELVDPPTVSGVTTAKAAAGKMAAENAAIRWARFMLSLPGLYKDNNWGD